MEKHIYRISKEDVSKKIEQVHQSNPGDYRLPKLGFKCSILYFLVIKLKHTVKQQIILNQKICMIICGTYVSTYNDEASEEDGRFSYLHNISMSYKFVDSSDAGYRITSLTPGTSNALHIT